MIDELVLERLFEETADEIAVPEHGAAGVITEMDAAHRTHRASVAGPMKVIVSIAAGIAVLVGIGAVLSGGSTGSRSKLSTASSADGFAAGSTAKSKVQLRPPQHAPAVPDQQAGRGRRDVTVISDGNTSPPSGPTDGAKIVKTGTVDLQVKRDTLRAAVGRVTGIATGLDGYVANSTTNYDGADPTGQITLRVPVDNFEAAIKQLKALPDVKVLGDSETGKDVTAQYVDLQAQLTARQNELTAYNTILAAAQSIPDILNVTDRIGTVQAQINQLQGQINVLGDKSAFSAIAVTLAEKPATPAAAHLAAPPTGLSKAWKDARDGFSNSLEWIIARSGGALIVLLAGLLLAFALRYLYPVVRRALL